MKGQYPNYTENGSNKGLILIAFVIGLVVMAFSYPFLFPSSSPPTGGSLTACLPSNNACVPCPECKCELNMVQAKYLIDNNGHFEGQGSWPLGGTTINVPVTNKDNKGTDFQITLTCKKVKGTDILKSEKIYIETNSQKIIPITYSNIGSLEDYSCDVSAVDAEIIEGCRNI